MLLEITKDGNLRAIAERMGEAFTDACNEAVKNTTEAIDQEFRDTVAGALGYRASNLIKSRFFNRPYGGVKGYIYSRWWRGRNTTNRPDLPGKYGITLGTANSPAVADETTPDGAKDVLAAFAYGATIQRPGGYLYISFLGKGVLNRRARPNLRDRDISLVPLRNGRGYLILDRRGGTTTPVRSGKGRRPVRATSQAKPIGLLLKETRVPQRLNLEPLRELALRRVGEELFLSLSRRGVDVEVE